MEQFACWKPADRAAIFTETAAQMGISPVLVEKDFWVCWTLNVVFSLEEQPRIIFKGGTSLSKAYHLIERFSEDIDLAFHRGDLGFTGNRDPEHTSASQRRKLLKELSATSISHISDRFLPSLRGAAVAMLQNKRNDNPELCLEIDSADPQTILFAYPRSLPPGLYTAAEYVPPSVRLELGARSDHSPASTHTITSYAAAHFREHFKKPSCIIPTLEARRTFCEKATIAHALYHRQESTTKNVSRLSRHYYDLEGLIKGGVGQLALEDIETLLRVAEHKRLYYPAAWAKYELARPGTLRIKPHKKLEKLLRRDYEQMTEMFFSEPPRFDAIVQSVEDFERTVNNTGQ